MGSCDALLITNGNRGLRERLLLALSLTFHVQTAGRAAAFFEAFRTHPLALILLDYRPTVPYLRAHRSSRRPRASSRIPSFCSSWAYAGAQGARAPPPVHGPISCLAD